MQELDLVGVGDRIRQVRGRLTQAAFAEQLGVERKTIVRYESGERAPDALTLLRLSSSFGAQPNWVLTGEGDAPALSDEESELLTLYRATPLAGKLAAIGALQGVLKNDQAQASSKVSHAPSRVAVSGVRMKNSGTGGIQIGHAGGKVSIKKGR